MKYLICAGTGIGDFAILLPVAKGIREHDKDAYITLLYPVEKEKVIEKQPLFDMQCVIDDWTFYSKKQLIQSLVNVVKCKVKSYDYGLCAQYTNSPNTSVYFSLFIRYACKKTIGLDVSQNPKIHFDITVPRDTTKRVWSGFEDVIKQISPDIALNYTKLLKDERLISLYEELDIEIDPVRSIILCPGTVPVSNKINGQTYYNDIKRWPYESWVELANKLSSEGYQVVFMGGKTEERQLEQFRYEINKLVVNLCGKLKVDQSISVLSKTNYVVGCDTGLMHWAGLFNKRCITLFGATDYRHYLTKSSDYIVADESLKCAPCFGTERAAFCTDHKCMNNIKVNDVYKKIEKLVESGPHEHSINS